MKAGKPINPGIEPVWTREIKAGSGLFHFNFKEVWEYRDLTFMLVKRDLTAQYKQSILGPAWFVVQPVILTLIFTFVFGNIAGIPTEGLPGILFYLGGLVTWNFFADCVQRISATLITNAPIFSKVYFPRLIVPIASLTSAFVKFLVQFILFVAIFFWFRINGYQVFPGEFLFWFPLILLIMALNGLGLGLLISSATTRFRDLQFMVGFGLQMWMYLTPVVYSSGFVSGNYAQLLSLNPMAPLVEGARTALLGAGSFTPSQLLFPLLFSILLSIAGLVVFNRVEKNFIDTI